MCMRVFADQDARPEALPMKCALKAQQLLKLLCLLSHDPQTLRERVAV